MSLAVFGGGGGYHHHHQHHRLPRIMTRTHNHSEGPLVVEGEGSGHNGNRHKEHDSLNHQQQSPLVATQQEVGGKFVQQVFIGICLLRCTRAI